MHPNDNRRPRRCSTPGVYFVVGAGLVKIGIVKASWSGQAGVRGRFATMQCHSPVPLRLHRFVATARPAALEVTLHTMFAAHRRHGEWFDDCVLDEVDCRSDADLLALLQEQLDFTN